MLPANKRLESFKAEVGLRSLSGEVVLYAENIGGEKKRLTAKRPSPDKIMLEYLLLASIVGASGSESCFFPELPGAVTSEAFYLSVCSTFCSV